MSLLPLISFSWEPETKYRKFRNSYFLFEVWQLIISSEVFTFFLLFFGSLTSTTCDASLLAIETLSADASE